MIHPSPDIAHPAQAAPRPAPAVPQIGRAVVKRLVIDLDDTLTIHGVAASYDEAPVREDVVARLREYHAAGFEIVVHTARNMRTHAGNVGRINVATLPGIIAWLDRHDIPYDEIVVGKPWCGTDGFYVDDRAVRPDEFAALEPAAIRRLLGMGPAAPDVVPDGPGDVAPEGCA